MKKTVVLIGLVLWALVGWTQEPTTYYSAAEGLTGEPLKVALHEIIKGHTTIDYGQLWNAFWSTDNKGNGVVWDMYSDIPGGTPPYTFAMGVDQCGSDHCSVEGMCYNREHSWPQSWFKKQSTPRTDLHHIFPTDCLVNYDRADNPYGEVRSGTTYQNGSRLGPCKTPGYTGTVFEPIDEYKGDFARAFFYMSVRYYGEDSEWKTTDMTDKSVIKPWAMAMLLRWNKLDPVSPKEIDRNNVIYNDYQLNRNPFVDHPEFADKIWDPTWSVSEESEDVKATWMVVYDLTGRKLLQSAIDNENEATTKLENTLKHGCYLLMLMDGNRVVVRRKLLVN